MNEEKEDNFFKKIIISIKNPERYPELASKRWGLVTEYMIKLILILALVASFAFIYTIYKNYSNLTTENTQEITIVNKFLNTLKDYYSGTNEILMYVGISIMIYLEMFIVYSINTIIYVLLLGGFGYFTAIILRIRLKFSAMCKITVHSLTLPIILEMIYMIINALTGFEIKYFDIMYIGIAYIYIISTILIIKSDVIKNKEELTKIMEEQEKVRQELERKKQKEEEEKAESERKKQKEKQRKKEKNEENEEDEEDSNEVQGENA